MTRNDDVIGPINVVNLHGFHRLEITNPRVKFKHTTLVSLQYFQNGFLVKRSVLSLRVLNERSKQLTYFKTHL